MRVHECNYNSKRLKIDSSENIPRFFTRMFVKCSKYLKKYRELRRRSSLKIRTLVQFDDRVLGDDNAIRVDDVDER